MMPLRETETLALEYDPYDGIISVLEEDEAVQFAENFPTNQCIYILVELTIIGRTNERPA